MHKDFTIEQCQKLEEVCLEIARTTMFDSRPVDFTKILTHAENLKNKAIASLISVPEQNIDIDALIDTVVYINNEQSIPSYKDDTEWFFSMLCALYPLAISENVSSIITSNNYLNRVKRNIDLNS